MKAVALGVNEQQIETFLLPVQANNHPIYNPSLDYSVYLSQPFFFVLFQVLVLLITVYAVGSEIKFGTAGQWLQAGHDIITVAGQVVTLYAYLQPDRYIRQLCHVWHPAYTFSRELAAAQRDDSALYHFHSGTGIVHLLPVPAVAIIISIVSMVGSLGATLSGVTFPVLNMYPLVRDASYLFPVRHYTEITQTMLYYGGDLSTYGLRQ